MSRPDAAVNLHAIARRYGRRWALRGVSLDVAAGEVLAVVGHNGSGKTTLLRVVATAIPPTLGHGTVLGRDIMRESEHVRQLVALLGHRPGVYDDLTATENLLFAARMLGVADERAAVSSVLERVGLARDANERARTFSSGMQRRLSLARVMLQRPRLLLLDEPYHSFDADGVTLVNSFISATTALGGAVILVSHDVHRAESVVDRTVELSNGVIASSAAGATPADLVRARGESARLHLTGASSAGGGLG